MAKRILVTGGAGFIGSALVRHLIAHTEHEVLNLDKLTYAGDPRSLNGVTNNPRYRFLRGDICDAGLVRSAFESFRPDIVTHLAAESHVDRSIDGPAQFVETNVTGTFTMLSEAVAYWRQTPATTKDAFRFHHISTDEVFGSLGDEGFFTETTAYDPRSPYSASKAASDHLVRAWGHTYGLPVVITNCSNNYGPFHFPEKLIPLMILNCLRGLPLPVYGNGANIRDWLYVEDHARALTAVFEGGRTGESYIIGGKSERTNLQVVHTICAILDDLKPAAGGGSYSDLITYVSDRPGHDQRYAIDPAKIQAELGWTPQESFESGIRQTVRWYLDNEWWWGPILAKTYSGERLGLKAG